MGLVTDLLIDKKIQYREKGKDILISCLNPEHEDENPSLRIDRETGIFGCFGCGYSGEIFKYFNRTGPKATQAMQRVFNAIREASDIGDVNLGFPNDAMFNVTPMKGLPVALLKKYYAFATDTLGLENRLCMPIMDGSGNIKAYLGRHKHSDASPKYLMYPKEVRLNLYPTVSMLEGLKDTLIIVEGLFDALHLINNGIPNVTCAFGTKMLGMDNIAEQLSPFMCAGVERVVLMMDGDNAGIAANSKIKKAIEYKTDLIVEVLPLPEGEDPGSLSDDQLTMVKNYLNSL